MAPTYTYTFDPSTSNKDAVRFLCQDTDMTTGTVRLCDEEINFTLRFQSNIWLAAADCADVIAAYWARVQNTFVGPLRVMHGQQAQFFQQLAAELRRQASRKSGAQPVFYPVGNPNYVDAKGNVGPQHLFTVGIDDFPGYSQFWPPGDFLPADVPPLTSY